MGTRITGGDPPKKKAPDPRSAWNKYPTEVEIGCLNTVAHKGYQIVNFKIPKGRKSAVCPECGRRAGRK